MTLDVFIDSRDKIGSKGETDTSGNSDDRKRKIEETDKFLKQCEQRNTEDAEFSKTLERKKSQNAGPITTSPLLVRKFETSSSPNPKVNLLKLPVSTTTDSCDETNHTDRYAIESSCAMIRNRNVKSRICTFFSCPESAPRLRILYPNKNFGRKV